MHGYNINLIFITPQSKTAKKSVCVARTTGLEGKRECHSGEGLVLGVIELHSITFPRIPAGFAFSLKSRINIVRESVH